MKTTKIQTKKEKEILRILLLNKELTILCLTVLFVYKSITRSIAGLKLASHVLIIYKQNVTMIYVAKVSEIEFSTSFDGEGDTKSAFQ